METLTFDYYYGDESEQFRFLRVPKALMKSPMFRDLSNGARLLYGLLLDRMGLSARNGWYDDQGRVFLYYALTEIQEELNCCHDTATKWFRELETIGLIERKKKGMGIRTYQIACRVGRLIDAQGQRRHWRRCPRQHGIW